jgi:uncharacterized protein (DUF58 family)
LIPTGRLLLLVLGPIAASVLAVVWPEQLQFVWIADGVFVLIAGFDLLTLPRRSKLLLERKASEHLSVGRSNRFALEIRNNARRAVYVEVIESFPSTMAVDGLPAARWIKAGQTASFVYSVVPSRRGAYNLARTYLRITSLLGLWKKQVKRQLDHPMKVYPDVKILGTYALLARRNRIDLMGFRQTRGRAADVEFDRLREYQRDDDYRRIDPFASARHRKLITREYQVSRNQNIVFMVDCSRLMAGESSNPAPNLAASESRNLSALDHALNATLMLSHLALEQGDNVGLLAFDDQIRKILPIASGIRSKAAVLQALYDLKVGQSEADYELAFLTLQRHIRQRSLVVLMTNVMDDASFELLAPHLKVLTRRHLPLVVLLRDQDLFDLAEKVPTSATEFYQVGAAAELASWREQVAKRIQQLGGLVLDIQPFQTTPELINTYLRVKANQLL